MLIFSLAQPRSVVAQGVAQVLRGRALEIVDDQGRVRASISVLPGDPTRKMPDGSTGFTETVLVRLINSKGRPNVKLQVSDEGSGLMLAGESDPTYIQIGAKGTNTSLKLTNKDGRQQLIKP